MTQEVDPGTRPEEPVDGRGEPATSSQALVVPPRMVLVTGMSGAGRSTAANALEDLGWYVVDNIPPSLVPRLFDLGRHTNGAVQDIAAVVDVRSRSFFTDLRSAFREIEGATGRPRVLFLEASDDVLVRRFESSRRPHPLQGAGRVLDGINGERELLSDLRAEADIVIDTSGLNVHQLAARISEEFTRADVSGLRATVMSFGYKYGLPADSDLVVDCRFLPNPHWVPELRPLTGQDDPVADYVLEQPGAREFVDRYADLLQLVAEGYRREGKRYVTLSVGCTGGKHRSVAISEQLARALEKQGVETTLIHRDVGRE